MGILTLCIVWYKNMIKYIVIFTKCCTKFKLWYNSIVFIDILTILCIIEGVIFTCTNTVINAHFYRVMDFYKSWKQWLQSHFKRTTRWTFITYLHQPEYLWISLVGLWSWDHTKSSPLKKHSKYTFLNVYNNSAIISLYNLNYCFRVCSGNLTLW